jgi:hypothetical protein
MKLCATVKNLFSSYLDKTISPESQEILEKHVETCSNCRQILSNMRFLSVRLGNVSKIAASDTFDQKLRARIRENQPISVYTNTMKTFSYGLSAAAILAVVYIFVNSDPMESNPQITAPKSNPPAMQTVDIKKENPEKSIARESDKTVLASEDSVNIKKAREEETRHINLVDQ